MDAYRAQADRALAPHDSVNSRPSEGFDDFENDEIAFEGPQTPIHAKPGIGISEAVRSPPQLPPLMEEHASPGFEGKCCILLSVRTVLESRQNFEHPAAESV